MSNILLLEDDLSLINGLSFAFKKQGFELNIARTLKEAEELWTDGKYDLLVLDVSLPDGSGFEFCKRVRLTSKVPIIFLTASDEETSIIMGLDIGGDDYITKPFSPKELVLRVNNIIKRAYRDDNNRISIDGYELDEEQRKIYLSYLVRTKQELQDEINSNGYERSQIKILAALTRLRQICCHPSLFIDNYKEPCSKLEQCMEILEDGITAGHKILLFSSYTSMFEIIEKELKNRNIKYFKLTGATKVDERVDLVDEFNQNDEIKVFLISLKAGGTGLNLIGADMVIHYDPWWNISAENQATDRAYRIGQKNNVQVYKLITKDSIEEKIYDLQQRKATLTDNMLDTKTTFISKLSKEDIMNLFE